MSQLIRVFLAASLVVCLPLAQAARGDDKEQVSHEGPPRGQVKASQQKR